MTAWTVVCLVVVFLSFVASLGTVIRLVGHRRQLARHSALYQILQFFFGYLALWNFFRWIFYWIVLLDASLIQHERSDALGIKNIHLHPLTNWRVITIMILGDVALVSTALWLLALTRELFLLTKVTMDRGSFEEAIVTKRYTLVIHSLILLFATVEVMLAIIHGRYNAGIVYITVLGMLLQTLGVVYLAISLWMLRRKGRNLESVHGRVVLSPLYVRLRNLVLVFAVFSFQYQVFSLLFVKNGLEHVPTKIIGVSTVLFRFMGVALAFVMGISQELVVRRFRCCLPQAYVEQFLSPDCAGANASAASIEYFPTHQEPSWVSAPVHDPVLVYTDIESSSELWSLHNETIMQQANDLHDDLVRSLLVQYRGYEITTAGDAFQLAFASIKDAVDFCMQLQLKLLTAKWPKALHKCEIRGVQRQRTHGKLVFAGLRVRMGIHDAHAVTEGQLIRGIHPVTTRVTYTGLSEVIASQVSDLGHGGQILMTSRVADWVAVNKHTLSVPCDARKVGQYDLGSIQESVEVHQLLIHGLETRLDLFQSTPPRRLQSCVHVQIDMDGYEELQS